jgi:hypothetical protein
MLLALAVAIYSLGLGNPYIPTNGDEMVYAHIARLTAASGHWLPLVSELDNMRNTKPPLLFWQALQAGDWGHHWSLAALRTPSLVYTLLLAAMVAATVHGIPLGGTCGAGGLRLPGVFFDLSLRPAVPDQRARDLLAQPADVLAAVARAEATTACPSQT